MRLNMCGLSSNSQSHQVGQNTVGRLEDLADVLVIGLGRADTKLGKGAQALGPV